MKRNGYSGIELIILICVLGVVVLGVATTTSNAFKDNKDELYEDKIHLIEHQAEVYGKTLNNLQEQGSLIITLDDLISNGYYVTPDGTTDVVDPRNSKAKLNGIKIKLIYVSEDEIQAEVIEEV